jgi:transposase
MGGRKPQRLAGHAVRVRALIAGQPDLTIDGLRRRLADEGVTASRSAVGRTLLALGLTRKKRRRAPPSTTGTTSPKPGKPGSPDKPS